MKTTAIRRGYYFSDIIRRLLPPLPLLLAAACATAPQTPPEWAARGVEAAYPQAAYIAQEGRGKTRQAAETDALGAISRFFLAEVSSTTRSAAS